MPGASARRTRSPVSLRTGLAPLPFFASYTLGIVDDNQGIREAICGSVRSHACRVLAFDSAKAAMRQRAFVSGASCFLSKACPAGKLIKRTAVALGLAGR
ncbi:hypothetical protein ACFDR9_004643 [Janthinobacterium sp. CG_23.3]